MLTSRPVKPLSTTNKLSLRTSSFYLRIICQITTQKRVSDLQVSVAWTMLFATTFLLLSLLRDQALQPKSLWSYCCCCHRANDKQQKNYLKHCSNFKKRHEIKMKRIDDALLKVEKKDDSRFISNVFEVFWSMNIQRLLNYKGEVRRNFVILLHGASQRMYMRGFTCTHK